MPSPWDSARKKLARTPTPETSRPTDFTMVARTMRGLEDVLARELEELGARAVRRESLAVSFTGDNALLYRANLYLYTALRILKPILRFSISKQDDLYSRMQRHNWAKHLGVEDTFAIDTAVHSPLFSNSQFVAFRAKDAIVDQFRDRTGKRPSVDLREPDLRLHIHINQKQCTVSLDSTGESLHRRGYRTNPVRASISEVLAAGMIKLSGWKYDEPFVDPMCGAGTIAIEAALQGLGLAPGLSRDRFGFHNWPDFEIDLWQRIRREARSRADENMRTRTVSIHASDASRQAVQWARRNLREAGLPREAVQFEAASLIDFRPPPGPGTVIMNPPYGERMPEPEIEALYKSIGDAMKQNFTGYSAWIISSNREALKRIGLRASEKHQLYNGPLECSFRRYELYEGTAEV